MKEFIELLNQTSALRIIFYSVIGLAALFMICGTITEIGVAIFKRK